MGLPPELSSSAERPSRLNLPDNFRCFDINRPLHLPDDLGSFIPFLSLRMSHYEIGREGLILSAQPSGFQDTGRGKLSEAYIVSKVDALTHPLKESFPPLVLSFTTCLSYGDHLFYRGEVDRCKQYSQW